jgi:hypothetical protein
MLRKQGRGRLFINVVGTFKNPIAELRSEVRARKAGRGRLPPCRLAISDRKNGWYGVLFRKKKYAVFSARNRGLFF